MADLQNVNPGTETPAAQEPAAGTPDTSGFNIADFDAELSDGEAPVEVPAPTPAPAVAPVVQPPAATPPTPQTPPVTPTTPVSAAQPVAVSPQQTAQSAPAAPAPVTGTPAPQETSSAAQPPAQPTQPDFKKWAEEWPKTRQTAIDNLANQLVFSEEDQQALLTDPAPVLKRLGAQIMVDAYTQAYMAVMGNLPAVFESYMQQRSVNETAQKTFFERFPALNKPELRDDIATAYRMYAQAKPNATVEEAMMAAGAHVHMLKGIPYQQPGAPQATPQPISAPAHPPAPQQMRPFVPAGPGGSAPAPVDTGANFWTNLAQEFEREDL